MNVHYAEARDLQNFGRQDSAVCDDNEDVCTKCPQVFLNLWISQPFRRFNLDAMGFRRNLHCGRSQSPRPPRGTVRARVDSRHIVACLAQSRNERGGAALVREESHRRHSAEDDLLIGQVIGRVGLGRTDVLLGQARMVTQDRLWRVAGREPA